jgi:3-dehydroquinate synthetase
LSETDAAAVLAVLSRLGPFPEPVRDPARLRGFLSRDKKATARGLAAILLERVGSARVDETVTADEWLEAAAIMSL